MRRKKYADKTPNLSISFPRDTGLSTRLINTASISNCNAFSNPSRLAFELQLSTMEKCKFAIATDTGINAAEIVLSGLVMADRHHIVCAEDISATMREYLMKFDVTYVDMGSIEKL